MDPRALGDAVPPDDLNRFAQLTPEERLEIFAQLCELTDAIVRERPDADRLRAPAPRSPESEALWRRLIEKAIGERDRA